MLVTKHYRFAVASATFHGQVFAGKMTMHSRTTWPSAHLNILFNLEWSLQATYVYA